MTIPPVAPGVAFEATTYGFPTGLVGTIGVRIMDGQGATVTARTTAGIIEAPAGSGIYTATSLIAPNTAGQYQIVWDDTALFVPDDLVVTYTASAGVLLDATNLCTLAQVKRDPTLAAVGSTLDDLITETITQASLDFLEETDREIVLLSGTNPHMREVDVGGYWAGRVIPIGDMAAAPTAVVVVDGDGTTVRTLTVATDVDVRPRVRQAWEPVTHLRLRARAGSLSPDYRLQVTGTWGWPAVPLNVQLAVRDTVVFRLRQHRALTSQSPEQIEEASGPQRLFPASAMQVIRRYQWPVSA